MKISRLFSGLFLFFGMVLALLAICLVMGQPGTKPTLIGSTQVPQNQVIATMDAICRGDFSGAEQYLLGQPSLGVDRELEDPVSAMIWNAFVESLSYELSGDCYATEGPEFRELYIEDGEIVIKTSPVASIVLLSQGRGCSIKASANGDVTEARFPYRPEAYGRYFRFELKDGKGLHAYSRAYLTEKVGK